MIKKKQGEREREMDEGEWIRGRQGLHNLFWGN